MSKSEMSDTLGKMVEEALNKLASTKVQGCSDAGRDAAVQFLRLDINSFVDLLEPVLIMWAASCAAQGDTEDVFLAKVGKFIHDERNGKASTQDAITRLRAMNLWPWSTGKA